MTALEQYTRLEAIGVWREDPDTPPIEVVVSFGESTLLLSDFNELPLSHWAMVATTVKHSDDEKTIYTTDTEGFETLEIRDADMIVAIAQVSNNSKIAPMPRNRILRWFFLGTLIMIGGIAVKSTPDFLRQQAVQMANFEVAHRLGVAMFETLDLRVCSQAKANSARDTLVNRAFPEGNLKVVITDGIGNFPVVFPGNLLVLTENNLHELRTSEALVVALKNMVNSDDSSNALGQLFSHSNLLEISMFVTTGKMSVDRLSTAANRLVSDTNSNYLETVGGQAPPLLRDQDWVALQNICLD